MKIVDFIWLEHIVDKLLQKHGMTQQEVVEVFRNQPWIRFAEKGSIRAKMLTRQWVGAMLDGP